MPPSRRAAEGGHRGGPRSCCRQDGLRGGVYSSAADSREKRRCTWAPPTRGGTGEVHGHLGLGVRPNSVVERPRQREP